MGKRTSGAGKVFFSIAAGIVSGTIAAALYFRNKNRCSRCLYNADFFTAEEPEGEELEGDKDNKENCQEKKLRLLKNS